MINHIIIDKLARLVWEETRFFNISVKKTQPKLKPFYWPCFQFLLPEIRHEYKEWIAYLLFSDLPDFSADERHLQAISNRIAAGWVIGEERNDAAKEDPYLIPLSDCESWFQEWCADRDKIMIRILKQEFRNWNHISVI
jgi:hypothetical protein